MEAEGKRRLLRSLLQSPRAFGAAGRFGRGRGRSQAAIRQRLGFAQGRQAAEDMAFLGGGSGAGAGGHFSELGEFGQACGGAEGAKTGARFDQGANFLGAGEILGRTVKGQKIVAQRVVGGRGHAGGHFPQGSALGAGFDDGGGFLGQGQAQRVAVGDLALAGRRKGLEAKAHLFGAGAGGLENPGFGLGGFGRAEGFGGKAKAVGPCEACAAPRGGGGTAQLAGQGKGAPALSEADALGEFAVGPGQGKIKVVAGGVVVHGVRVLVFKRFTCPGVDWQAAGRLFWRGPRIGYNGAS